jgi:hypothetical protein
MRQFAPGCPLSFSLSIKGLMAPPIGVLRQIPLAYRVEQGDTRLGNQERTYKQTDRPGPGRAGPAYPLEKEAANWNRLSAAISRVVKLKVELPIGSTHNTDIISKYTFALTNVFCAVNLLLRSLLRA